MAKFVVMLNEVFVDGVDISDKVVSITLEMVDGSVVTRESGGAAQQRLAAILKALTHLAAPTEGERV